MGGRSSKYIKRSEYHAQLQQVQQLLEEMKRQQETEVEDIKGSMRKMQLDMNNLQSAHQIQVRFFDQQ